MNKRAITLFELVLMTMIVSTFAIAVLEGKKIITKHADKFIIRYSNGIEFREIILNEDQFQIQYGALRIYEPIDITCSMYYMEKYVEGKKINERYY